MKNEIRPDYTARYLLPPEVEDWVSADHPARFIREFVDSLDLAALGFKSREVEVGAPSYSADLLLKVWLYGYLERIRSTRKLERACMDSMCLIWLTGNNAPDHNTLWRFYRDNRDAFKAVCRRTVEVAARSGLVGIALHAVDGTKVRSAASGRNGLRRKDLEKLLRRADESVEEMSREVESREEAESGESRLPEELRDRAALKGRIEGVLREMDERGVNHLNPGDPDARMTKVDGRSEFGYNAQAVVDSESGLIVGEDVASDCNDNHLLNDMLDEVEENAGEVAEETVADGGYYSGEELSKAEERNRSVLVNMEGKSGGEGDGEFHASKFVYDAERDCVTCPLGERLVANGTVRSRNGEPIKIYRCRKRECESRTKCTRCKTGRVIKIARHHEAMVRQREKQRNELNKNLLRKRKAIVERVFGLIKEVMGFRRFSVRGIDNVRATWSLLCTVYNLGKLHDHWLNGDLNLGRSG